MEETKKISILMKALSDTLPFDAQIEIYADLYKRNENDFFRACAFLFKYKKNDTINGVLPRLIQLLIIRLNLEGDAAKEFILRIFTVAFANGTFDLPPAILMDFLSDSDRAHEAIRKGQKAIFNEKTYGRKQESHRKKVQEILAKTPNAKPKSILQDEYFQKEIEKRQNDFIAEGCSPEIAREDATEEVYDLVKKKKDDIQRARKKKKQENDFL